MYKLHDLERDTFAKPVHRKLIRAIVDDDINAVQHYVASGEEVTFAGERGINPLYVALEHKRLNIFRLLVNSGYDVNQLTKHFCPAFAALWSAPEATVELKLMLDAGLNPNLSLDGETLLFHADEAPTIQMLLKAGADLNARNPTGENVTIAAARAGRWHKVLLLLPTASPETLEQIAAILEHDERHNIPFGGLERRQVSHKLKEMGVIADSSKE